MKIWKWRRVVGPLWIVMHGRMYLWVFAIYIDRVVGAYIDHELGNWDISVDISLAHAWPFIHWRWPRWCGLLRYACLFHDHPGSRWKMRARCHDLRGASNCPAVAVVPTYRMPIGQVYMVYMTSPQGTTGDVSQACNTCKDWSETTKPADGWRLEDRMIPSTKSKPTQTTRIPTKKVRVIS